MTYPCRTDTILEVTGGSFLINDVQREAGTYLVRAGGTFGPVLRGTLTTISVTTHAGVTMRRYTARNLIVQNGITRPGDGTITSRVWKIADDLSDLPDRPARRKDVMRACHVAGVDYDTSANMFKYWRKFNGVAPRRPWKGPRLQS